jgi:hypothetical protein
MFRFYPLLGGVLCWIRRGSSFTLGSDGCEDLAGLSGTWTAREVKQRQPESSRLPERYLTWKFRTDQ